MNLTLFVSVFIVGLVLEFTDCSLGGGYGTVLTPLFLGLGYDITSIVPMILLSEIITGFVAGVFHKGFGNVNMKIIPNKLPFAIAGCVAGTLVFVSIPTFWIKFYIGILVLSAGILMLRKYMKHNETSIQQKPAWWRVRLLGMLIGWNKAVSGGGYGPLSISGLSWSRISVKKAVGTTQLTESAVCLVSFTLYLLFKQVHIIWEIAIPLICGAVCATYPATYFTFKTKERTLGGLVALLVIGLGVNTLLKALHLY